MTVHQLADGSSVYHLCLNDNAIRHLVWTLPQTVSILLDTPSCQIQEVHEKAIIHEVHLDAHWRVPHLVIGSHHPDSGQETRLWTQPDRLVVLGRCRAGLYRLLPSHRLARPSQQVIAQVQWPWLVKDLMLRLLCSQCGALWEVEHYPLMHQLWWHPAYHIVNLMKR